MKTILYLLIAASVILVSGCRTVYLDTETPPGSVPLAPTPVAPAPVVRAPLVPAPIVPAPVAPAPVVPAPTVIAPPTAQPPRPAQGHAPAVPSERPPQAGISAETIVGFKRAYAEKGSPRIAVFLNRALSDEVREWRTPSRFVVSGNIKQARVTGPGAEVKTKGGPGFVHVDEHIEPERRPLVAEDWMWQFEESFLGEFLRAKAIMVDRATIMRLIATQSGKQGDPHDLLSVKTVEMRSLKQKADMFMELLVRRNPASPVGYEFKATVKEVDTGRLLANVSSLRWEMRELEDVTEVKWKATSRGYERETVTTKEETLLKLDRIAATLAWDVMDSLVEIWAPEE